MIAASEGNAAARIAQIAHLGFESFEPFFWQTTNGQNLAELGKRCRDAIGGRDIVIQAIGMFGNPLEDQPLDRETLSRVLKNSPLYAVFWNMIHFCRGDCGDCDARNGRDQRIAVQLCRS